MKITVKNRLTPARGSRVVDDKGKNLLKVKGVWLSPFKTKKICDMDGNLLFKVKNKFWAFWRKKCYIFNPEKEKIGTLSQNSLSFKVNSFQTEDFEKDVQVNGKIFRAIDVIVDGVKVADISRSATWASVFFRSIDVYTLTTEDMENLPFYVAIVIAIDNIRDTKEKN